MTTPLVLENGGVCRKTDPFVMWGWSRRTGGQALWGGGRQQAAMKNAAKRERCGGTHSWVLELFFTDGQAIFEDGSVAGEAGLKLERLALKLKSYLC